MFALWRAKPSTPKCSPNSAVIRHMGFGGRRVTFKRSFYARPVLADKRKNDWLKREMVRPDGIIPAGFMSSSLRAPKAVSEAYNANLIARYQEARLSLSAQRAAANSALSAMAARKEAEEVLFRPNPAYIADRNRYLARRALSIGSTPETVMRIYGTLGE